MSHSPDAPDGAEGRSPQPTPSLQRSALRGARLAFVGWAGTQGLTFVAYLVLARLVDPADFGRFAAASVVTGIGGLFAESGMMSALINRRDRIEEAASTAFFSLLLGGVLLTLVAAAISPLLGVFFRSSSVGALSAALSGWLLLRALTVVPDALLQRRMSFTRRVAVDPLGAIAFTAVSIAACSQGARAWGLVAGTYASITVQVLASWLFVRDRPRLALASRSMWRELSAYARPVLGSEILRRVASQLDALMLGRFAGPASLGQYRNGVRLAQQPTLAFVDVGAYVLLPTLARLQDQPERLKAAAARVYGVALAATLPIGLASIPLGVPVAVLALGQRWRPAGHAIAGLAGLVVGVSLTSVTSEIFKATGRPEKLVRIHAFSLVLTAVLVISAAIPFGLLGVAIAVSLTQLGTGLFAFGLVLPLIDLRWRDLVRFTLRPALASVAMLAAMQAFALLLHPLSRSEASGLALTVAQVLLAGLVYVLVLIGLDQERRTELLALAESGAQRFERMRSNR